jgi:hypothetical protein
VIPAQDPRVTYTKTALRSLFTLQGYAVQSPFPVEAVFTALPATPSVARWFVRILGAPGGTGTASVTNDRGVTGVTTFNYTSQVSDLIQFPAGDGAITLYGPIDVGQYWDITYRQKTTPWVQVAANRLGAVDPSGFLSPRLSAAFRTSPLVLDRLAAVVAGLGGGQ